MAKILGPRPCQTAENFLSSVASQGVCCRKLIPNPKSGSVVTNLKAAIKEADSRKGNDGCNLKIRIKKLFDRDLRKS